MKSGQARYDAVVSRLVTCPGVEVGHIGTREQPVFRARVNPGASRPVFVVGGIHGDEVAGVSGIMEFICRRRFPSKLSVDFFPVLNPTGFASDTRGKDGRDLNRDVCKSRMQPETSALLEAVSKDRPILLATLHEDGSQDGFYMYYSDEGRKTLWERMARLASDFFPLASGDIHGDQCVNGLIPHPKKDRVLKAPKHLCSLENAAREMGVDYLTTETPMGSSLSRRTLLNRKLLDMLLHAIP